MAAASGSGGWPPGGGKSFADLFRDVKPKTKEELDAERDVTDRREASNFADQRRTGRATAIFNAFEDQTRTANHDVGDRDGARGAVNIHHETRGAHPSLQRRYSIGTIHEAWRMIQASPLLADHGLRRTHELEKDPYLNLETNANVTHNPGNLHLRVSEKSVHASDHAEELIRRRSRRG